MAEEWFVVPLATETDPGGNEITKPDFFGHAIDRYQGIAQDFSDTKFDDLPWYPDTMYVVHLYADQSVLDALAAEDGAWGKAHEGISDAEVASYLNDRHSDDFTWEEWQSRYKSA